MTAATAGEIDATAPVAVPLVTSRGRLAVLTGVFTYAVSFFAAYQISIVPRYEYFGMGRRDLPSWVIALLIVVSVAPAALAPVRLVRPSQLLYWAMYLLLYVPSIFLAFYSNLPRLEIGDAVALDAVLCAAMMMLGLGYRIDPRRILVRRVAPSLMYLLLASGAVGLYALMLAQFRGQFRWVGFTDVSGQREVFLASVTGTFGAYAFAWIVAVVNPVLVALGGVRRSATLVVAGLAGQVLMYGAAAAKGVLLTLVVLPVLILLVNRFQRKFGLTMAVGIALLVALAPAADLAGFPLIGAGLTFVVVFRTLAIPGLATTQYAGFFADHPHTLGSHVTGLSSLVDYPYHTTLDYLVGQFYYGQVNMGLNASTWASDGLAAFGLPGVLLATFLCASLFWLIDSAADGLDIQFTVVALAYGIVNFSNVPLFTNLVTGGIALMVLVFTLWPRPTPPLEAV
ncbi:MAG: hypothetical protein IT357_12710 [Gemmatimonadaceae bacterium]|nr:hypothetical protein [Gemmatimonadaceae bacterium]